MAHIEARDITLTYQTPSGAVPAVHGVSFGIETSEFLCIVGPSGCGKSTLLNIVAGFLSPTAGEIRIAGAPVKGYGTDRGVVFQDFAQLFPWRTALGNVAFGLEMKGVPKTEREGSRSNSSAWSSLRISLAPIRIISPAACSNGSRSPVRSLIIPRCCSWTSHSRLSTR